MLYNIYGTCKFDIQCQYDSAMSTFTLNMKQKNRIVMNEAHVHVFTTSSVRNVSLCVCMTSLSHTQSTATVDPMHQHPLALGTSL